MASWAQYWFDAQQKARRPRLFYGGDAQVMSPLVYFICHHVYRFWSCWSACGTCLRIWHGSRNGII